LQRRKRDDEWLSNDDYDWMIDFANRHSKTEHAFIHEDFNSPKNTKYGKYRKKRRKLSPRQRERQTRKQRENRARTRERKHAASETRQKVA
jgi:hypothetical protein